MLVLAALLSAVAVITAAALKATLLAGPPARLEITNFRGRVVPSVGGLVILMTVLVCEALLAMAALLKPVGLSGSRAFSPAAIPDTFVSGDHAGFILLVVGFFALGLLDDLAGSGKDKGLRGHLTAMKQGRLTTGAVKLLGGGLIAFVAASLWELRIFPALVDALLVALAANLINLLDLRPGRASKWFLIGWLPMVLIGWHQPWAPLSAVVATAVIVWIGTDLAERGSLGDSGSNLLGAVLGAGAALVAPTGVKILLVLLLGALTAASERFSFTKVIEDTPALRWFDSLGRVREEN